MCVLPVSVVSVGVCVRVSSLHRQYDFRDRHTHTGVRPVPFLLRPVILFLNLVFLLSEPTVVYYLTYVAGVFVCVRESSFFRGCVCV